jgi:uncharacterized protein YkwD
MGRTRVAGSRSFRAASAVCAAIACCALVGLASGCTAKATSRGAHVATRTIATPTFASDGGEVFGFPSTTQSPLGITQVPATLAPLFAQCQLGDAALSRVAERFARRQAQGNAPLDVAEISFAVRAEGSPYVWPRAWTLEGGDLHGPEAVERMRAWLASFSDGGERRCGVALSTTRERSVLSVVAVDALADLEPLPVRLRAGTWVDVNASVLVPATDAKVIVLGPSGAPAAVPTSFDGRHARARFRADRPGAFLIQLLASVEGGPRPVLEASVYADSEPPTSFFGDAAPGEPRQPLAANADKLGALFEMVNQARQAEQSPSLERDATLDEIAERHAQAMRKQRRIAHDAGDGDPRSRVEAANLSILATGENVAHALDVTRAHRALWASPSHRENLLQPRFDRIGIGVALDPDGSIWVCEVFADFADQVAAPR